MRTQRASLRHPPLGHGPWLRLLLRLHRRQSLVVKNGQDKIMLHTIQSTRGVTTIPGRFDLFWHSQHQTPIITRLPLAFDMPFAASSHGPRVSLIFDGICFSKVFLSSIMTAPTNYLS